MEISRGGASEVQARPPLKDSDLRIDFDTRKAKRVTSFIIERDQVLASLLVMRDEVKVRIPISAELLPHHSTHQRDDFGETLGRLILPTLYTSPNLDHLYPFQAEGVGWLLAHKKGLLADEMGLGKTVQAASALRVLVNKGDCFLALVVCPKSLVMNWVAELKRWAGELLVAQLTPNDLRDEGSVSRIISENHVVVTNYEQLRTEHALSNRRFDLLIADEAHKLRNLETAVSRGLRRISAKTKWILTGTPIERDPRDLASILSILDPDRFSLDDEGSTLDVLRARAAPYILRRTRSVVLADLPQVISHHERLELEPSQRSSYDDLAKQARPGVDPKDLLSLITKLRQICEYDPRTKKSSKIARSVELIQSVLDCDQKVIVFSFLLEPLRALKRELERAGLGDSAVFLEGSMNTQERGTVLERFKQSPQVSVLLASSRVASEGLTLTVANNVIFLNRWWNPSANNQARDRVVRIGQDKTVYVYSFTCVDTVEESLEKILKEKDATFSEIVGRLSNLTEIDSKEARQVMDAIIHDL